MRILILFVLIVSVVLLILSFLFGGPLQIVHGLINVVWLAILYDLNS